jgi:predicted Zn-dependent protease
VRIVSLLTLALAVVACAWFALGIRQAHEIAEATKLVSQAGALSSSESAHVASLLRAAGQLDPDSAVDVLRARLAIRENKPRSAKRITEDVVGSEPMNLLAWNVLATVSGDDARTERVALEHIAQLHPHVPEPR